MTLMAVLRISFVSFMSSKQKGFLYQIDSYRALNLANAGVEYMIKYVNEETSNYDSSFFSSVQPFTLPLKEFVFADDRKGTFSASYAFDQSIGNDILTVTGAFGNTTRQAKLSRFRYYAFENITRVPGTLPTSSSNDIIIPIIFNPDRNAISNITVARIGIWFDSLTRHLQNIYFESSATPSAGGQIYNYSKDSNFTNCPIGEPYCRVVGEGIYVPQSDSHYETWEYAFDISNFLISESDGIRWCIIRFKESNTQLSGLYRITFYNTASANVGTVYFRIP